MKKLLIGFLLAMLTLTSFAASNADDPLKGKDRIYLYNKAVWVFLDGFVNDPPYASFWSGTNSNTKGEGSYKALLTFHCKKRLVRTDAFIIYSLPDNKGEILKKDYEKSSWRPVEPESFFNLMYKIMCKEK